MKQRAKKRKRKSAAGVATASSQSLGSSGRRLVVLTAFLLLSVITAVVGFGLPYGKEISVVAVIAEIFAVASMLWWLFPNKVGLVAAWVVFPAAVLLLVDAHDRSLQNLETFWLLCASILVGAGAGKVLDKGQPFNGLPLNKAWITGLVLLVITVGGFLRFYGIDFGLPGEYHPDERWKVKAIVDMQEAADLNPRYFLHPSLLLYCSYLTDVFLEWLGLEGPDTLFLAGRVVSAVSGTLSIFLVYAIGRDLYGAATGLIASSLFAVFPLHVTSSRYMKEDALLLFFLLACVVLTLKAIGEGKKAYLLLAGLLGGFAASTKYSGLLSFPILAVAPWLRSQTLKPSTAFLKWTCIAVLMIPVGFFLATPYSLIESDLFISDLLYERNHMLEGHGSAIDAWSQYWMYHLSRSIISGITFPTTVLALFGAGLLLWRRRVEDLFLVALILLFYIPSEWVKAKPPPQAERYILPCLPFLALSAAEFLRFIWQAERRLLASGLLIAAIGFPMFRTVALASEIYDDTRRKMALWMVENLPRGSHIYLDVAPYAPHFEQGEFITSPFTESRTAALLDIDSLKISSFDYLVLSSLSYDRYFTEPGPKSPVRTWFQEIFERVPIVKELRPRHGTYGFHNPTVTLFSLKEEDFARSERELALKREGKLEETTNEQRTKFEWLTEDN